MPPFVKMPCLEGRFGTDGHDMLKYTIFFSKRKTVMVSTKALPEPPQ